MVLRSARPKRARSWLTPVVVLAVAAAVGAMALREPAPVAFRASGSPRGLPAEGTLQNVGEQDFMGILVGLRGKPVVVNVWASWCAPCRTEMPLLQRAAKTYAGRVVILGLASKDDPDAAQKFLDDFGLTYPNVFDTTGRIRVALRVSAYPTTYVFDRHGKLITTVKGGISEQRLAALIDATFR